MSPSVNIWLLRIKRQHKISLSYPDLKATVKIHDTYLWNVFHAVYTNPKPESKHNFIKLALSMYCQISHIRCTISISVLRNDRKYINIFMLHTVYSTWHVLRKPHILAHFSSLLLRFCLTTCTKVIVVSAHYIAMKPHKYYGIWCHRQHNRLFNN